MLSILARIINCSILASSLIFHFFKEVKASASCEARVKLGGDVY